MNKFKIAEKEVTKERSVDDFIASGIACHAFNLIERMGILKVLQREGVLENRFKHPIAVRAALLSLLAVGIVDKSGEKYSLTTFGHRVASKSGLIKMLFEGYGRLLAEGVVKNGEMLMNHKSIAEASIQFGEAVDEQLIEVIQKLRPKGTICDLGCGTGHTLAKICPAIHRPGLGIDINDDAFINVGDLNISLEQGDVTKLEGVWEDIDIVLQSFVAHDFFPDDTYVSTLASYRKNFPHMKYFIVIDIVSSESSFMPGYDYVHGLLGIETRSHEKSVRLFKNAGYEVVQEVAVPSLPNTFIWVLTSSSR